MAETSEVFCHINTVYVLFLFFIVEFSMHVAVITKMEACRVRIKGAEWKVLCVITEW